MKALTSVKIKTRIHDAKTGKILKESPWQHNLVLDIGLNGLARDASLTLQCGPASIHRYCQVGSGTNPVKEASGAVTATQAGTTVTASGSFFTAGMVGSILKYGTGTAGAEYYITAFTSATVVEVDTSATVGTGTVFTIWNVQQTALQTKLFESATYQTTAGDCSTTQTNNVGTHQRTYTFPVQGAPYTVNEIGYAPISSASCCGRLVLSSSDVVGTTNFYVVVIAFSVTYSPATPSAVADLGVNFNTAGTAAYEWNTQGSVISTSTGATTQSAVGLIDAASEWSGAPTAAAKGVLIARIGATYTQNANPSATSLEWGTLNTNYLAPSAATPVAWTKVAGSVGKCRLTIAGNLTTSGQTCYGIGISGVSAAGDTSSQHRPLFDILLTTPQVLPTGSWQPSAQFELTYGRALEN
jgi:hypothetical protein